MNVVTRAQPSCEPEPKSGLSLRAAVLGAEVKGICTDSTGPHRVRVFLAWDPGLSGKHPWYCVKVEF